MIDVVALGRVQRHVRSWRKPTPHSRHIQRAHEIWIEEGKPDGKAEDHWLRALWELEQALGPKVERERLEREFELAHV